MTKELHFDTQQIHAGAKPDPATGARQIPIYQTTAYVFRDAEHAANLFNLAEVGYIYSRLTNPTVAASQQKTQSWQKSPTVPLQLNPRQPFRWWSL